MKLTALARKHAFLFVFVVLLASPNAFGKLRKWNKNMQELSKAFSELLPELVDSKPLTPARQKKLEKNTKKLLDLAHTVNMGSGGNVVVLPPEIDPTIRFVSDLFEHEIKHAYHALNSGNTGYAKSILRTTTGYCIACHTRHDRGPDFPTFDLPANVQSLSPAQKAEWFAATRQFDSALDELEAIATDPKLAKTRPIEWGRSLRRALNISIRVKKDPDRAIALMNKVSALPNLSPFYASNLPIWKESLAEWKAEKEGKERSEEDLFSEAMRLTKAAKSKQTYTFDHSADVLYLRSSNIVHELLTRFPLGKRSSDAMLLAGEAYELLEDRLISRLPNMYYQACIRNAPHTPIAEQCYSHYEQNITFGYSGTAGTFIPDDIQDSMRELEKLSRIKSKI
jgi:hypothetical protein